MANVLWNKGREGILDGSIDMTGDVRVMLVKTGYVFDAADEVLDDLGATDNGRSIALASKTYTSGVFDAEDTSLTATDAEESDALAIFQHTGSDATARLIAYIDTPSAGLPFTPSISQTVNIVWDAGANKIFKL